LTDADAMGDAIAGLHEGFDERLSALLGRYENAISALTFDEARRLGAQGAEAAVAPLIWAAAVGERWSTTPWPSSCMSPARRFTSGW
jgi:hypothetical protein